MPGDGSGFQSWLSNGKSILPPKTLYDGGPRNWSFGFYYGNEQRNVVGDASPLAIKLDIVHLWGFVGYDGIPWLTVQVALGSAEVSSPFQVNMNGTDWTVGMNGKGRSVEVEDNEWAVGVRCRIMDYFFDTAAEPFRLQCNADVQYSKASGEDEVFSSWTVAFLTAPTDYSSVGAYGGLGFSFLNVSGAPFASDVSYKGDRKIGFVGGLTYSPDPYWFFKIEIEKFERVGSSVNIGVHF